MDKSNRSHPKRKSASGSRTAAAARPARIDVQLASRYAPAVRPAALKAAAQAALDVKRVQRQVSLTIVIAGDATLRRLNRDFLGLDAPTDVLSFANRPPRSYRPGRSHTEEYLGDVIISLMRARAQAKSGGHALLDELRLLVIHGVLHLLGHDHDTPERKRRMWSAQTLALKKTGAAIEGSDTDLDGEDFDA